MSGIIAVVVALFWIRCHGLPRRVGAAFGSRSAPEDGRRIQLNLGKKVIDTGRRSDAAVDVEAQVAVAPVQRPRLTGLGLAQPRDREGCPLVPVTLAPWRAPLNDGEEPRRHIAVDANLTTRPLGHAPGAPALYACDVEFG